MSEIHRVLDPAKGKTVPGGLCALAVMTKAPQAGRVKTRLTPPLTPHEAAALNTCFLRDTAAALAETSYVVTTTGSFDVMIEVVCRDRDVTAATRSSVHGHRRCSRGRDCRDRSLPPAPAVVGSNSAAA